MKTRLYETLDEIISQCQEPLKTRKTQQTNARNCVLFEAINLVIHLDRFVYWFSCRELNFLHL